MHERKVRMNAVALPPVELVEWYNRARENAIYEMALDGQMAPNDFQPPIVGEGVGYANLDVMWTIAMSTCMADTVAWDRASEADRVDMVMRRIREIKPGVVGKNGDDKFRYHSKSRRP